MIEWKTYQGPQDAGKKLLRLKGTTVIEDTIKISRKTVKGLYNTPYWESDGKAVLHGDLFLKPSELAKTAGQALYTEKELNKERSDYFQDGMDHILSSR